MITSKFATLNRVLKCQPILTLTNQAARFFSVEITALNKEFNKCNYSSSK